MYNEHIFDKQQVQYQPLSLSRASGKLIFGAGPMIPVAKTEDYTFPRVESKGPDVQVRCFTPEGEKPAAGWPVLIYFHGGGWVLGNIDTENVVSTNLCARAKCVVVSVDYRYFPSCIVFYIYTAKLSDHIPQIGSRKPISSCRGGFVGSSIMGPRGGQIET